jgi:hypothetical protein
MFDEQGRWHDNVTCKKCRRRHPAVWPCEHAAAVAATYQPAVPFLPLRDEREEWLEAFIERAGFRHGWWNLESWARRVAEQAYEERLKGDICPICTRRSDSETPAAQGD